MRMKTIVLILFTVLLACKKEDNKVCNCDEPKTELQWLKELISKAENDTTGNFQGKIYVEKYDNKDAFFVEMSMGSGGLMGYWFDCSGSEINTQDGTLIPKRNYLIYNNLKQ